MSVDGVGLSADVVGDVPAGAAVVIGGTPASRLVSWMS